MSELLIELLCEEIPAFMQKDIAFSFKEQLSAKLLENHFKFEDIKTLYSPRRITIIMRYLKQETQVIYTEKRGPRANAPDAALQGFCKSTGCDIADLELRDGFYYFNSSYKSLGLEDILLNNFSDIIKSVTLAKSMEWDVSKVRWIRPIRNILCINDGNVIAVELGNIIANNVTFGTRLIDNNIITISGANDYITKLLAQNIITCPIERKNHIEQNIINKTSEIGLDYIQDDKLLDEVTGLVESPTILLGKFDQSFLEIPNEALVVSMKINQRYFPLYKNGQLSQYFIIVANNNDGKDCAQMIKGHERVLKARLSDAKFFYDNDLKTKLKDRDLSKIIFHSKIGTVADKCQRIANIASNIFPEYKNDIEAASLLCKSDLPTNMVKEFPELQGVMGYYYAKYENMSDNVALAIKEHYMPIGASGDVPYNPVSLAVSIADKLDTIISMFAINEKPTGSKDPYALRRSAIGLIKCMFEIKKLFNKNILLKEISQASNEVMDFIRDRLKYSLKDQGLNIEIITAIIDYYKEDDIILLSEHINIINDFISTKDGEILLAIARRFNNILGDKTTKGEYDITLCESQFEKDLYHKYQEISEEITNIDLANFLLNGLNVLINLQDVTNKFFDNVMINVEDEKIKNNRIILIGLINDMINKVFNFSLIKG
jgi:glycyl-tRNA synthetase beta chain